MEAGMGDDLKVRHSIPTRVNVQPEHHIEKSTSGSEHQTESIPKATQINKEDNSTKRAEHNAAGATKQKELNQKLTNEKEIFTANDSNEERSSGSSAIHPLQDRLSRLTRGRQSRTYDRTKAE